MKNIVLSSYLADKILFQVELIDPAVKGTLNVLSSSKKASSVRRVILTSSLAAVVFTEKQLSPDVVIDETSFSIPEICEKAKVLPFFWEMSHLFHVSAHTMYMLAIIKIVHLKVFSIE
jgi:hypothetical protein